MYLWVWVSVRRDTMRDVKWHDGHLYTTRLHPWGNRFFTEFIQLRDEMAQIEECKHLAPDMPKARDGADDSAGSEARLTEISKRARWPRLSPGSGGTLQR